MNHNLNCVKITKIITYNINGIRAAIKKDLAGWLKSVNPDVVCLQEIKAMPDQFDTQLFEELGYSSFIHSATKKGYSGVAILSKIAPKNIQYGCGIEEIDFENHSILNGLICQKLIRISPNPILEPFHVLHIKYIFPFSYTIAGFLKSKPTGTRLRQFASPRGDNCGNQKLCQRTMT